MNLLTDVLQSQITRLQEEIRGLASWRTGIVQSVDPPTVLFPRDTTPTPADTLTQSLQPGQVVLTLTLMRRVWIVGVRGGSTFFPRLSIGKTWERGALDVAGDVWITGPTATDQPTLRMSREISGNNNELVLYVQAAATSTAALGVRTAGVFQASLNIDTSGQVSTTTLAGSPSPAANRPLPFGYARGIVDVEALATVSTVEIGVVFPANRFTQSPWVGVTNNGMSGALRHTVAARNITAAACTIRVANFTTGTGAAHTVGWVAIQ